MRFTKKLILALVLAVPFAVSCTNRPDSDTNTDTTTNSATTDSDSAMSSTDGGTDGTFGATGERVRRDPASVNDTSTVGTAPAPSTTTSTTATTPAPSRNDMNAETQRQGSTAEMPLSDTQYAQATKALRDRGYTVSSGPRGGPETTRAIQQFQAENRLPVTGAFDQETLKALKLNFSDRTPASVPDVDSDTDDINDTDSSM